MLERAARNLLSRNHSRWNLAGSSLSHRQTLHWSFWRHGAGDLEIPTWCVATLFEPDFWSFQGSDGWRGRRLDVALRVNQVLDTSDPIGIRKRWRRRLRSRGRWTTKKLKQGLGYGPRHFASLSNEPARQKGSLEIDLTKDDTLTEPHTQEDVSTEVSPAYDRIGSYDEDDISSSSQAIADPLARLQELLQHALYDQLPPVDVAEAWQLYESLPEQTRKDTELRRNLIHLLSRSELFRDTNRLVRILEALPDSERDSTLSDLAILSLLKHDKIERATSLFEHALSDPDFASSTASTALLISAFSTSRWNVLFHVWSGIRRSFGNSYLRIAAFDKWKREFMMELTRQLEIEDRAYKLLLFCASRPKMLEGYAAHGLLTALLSAVFERAGACFGIKRNAVALERIRQLGLSRAFYYEAACLAPFTANFENKDIGDVPFKFYAVYRQDAVFDPKRVMLQKLLSHAVQIRNHEAIRMLEEDWRRFYSLNVSKVTRLLMTFHAQRADTAKAEELLQEYLSVTKTKPVIQLFYPILHSLASVGGPKAVESRMAKIEEEHKLKLDLTCWNIYLHSFARIEDLDGAMECFRQIQVAGFKPDAYTVGTLMGILADRGDSSQAANLVRFAVNQHIPFSMPIYEGLVLAYINDDDMPKALEIAEQITSGDVAKSTRTWTQILVAYGTRHEFTQASEVAQRMRTLRVPFSEYTYAALLRVLVARRKLDQALRLMKRNMPEQGMTPSAIHYAIIIDGYASIGHFEEGLRAYSSMLENNIKTSLSVQVALLKLQTLAAKHTSKKDKLESPYLRFDVPEELLDHFLEEFDPSLVTSKEPQTLLRRANPMEAYPAVYFESLLTAYSSNEAFRTVKYLISKYHEKAAQMGFRSFDPNHTPLQILLALMKMRAAQRDGLSVTKYWKMSLETASVRAHSSSSSLHHHQPKDTPSSSSSTQISTVRRVSLARHLDVQMQNLFYAQDFSGIFALLRTYTSTGFALDNLNWNHYTQCLAQAGFARAAFTLCETRLMPNFMGWDSIETPATARRNIMTGRKDRGTEYMGKRFQPRRVSGTKGEGKMHVTYKTLVRLRQVLEDLQEGASGEHSTASKLSKHKANMSSSLRTDKRLEKLTSRGMEDYRSFFPLDSPVKESSTSTHENVATEEEITASDFSSKVDQSRAEVNILLETLGNTSPETVRAASQLPYADEGYAAKALGRPGLSGRKLQTRSQSLCKSEGRTTSGNKRTSGQRQKAPRDEDWNLLDVLSEWQDLRGTPSTSTAKSTGAEEAPAESGDTKLPMLASLPLSEEESADEARQARNKQSLADLLNEGEPHVVEGQSSEGESNQDRQGKLIETLIGDEEALQEDEEASPNAHSTATAAQEHSSPPSRGPPSPDVDVFEAPD
ncbi:MAG: hypothetical protein M1831_003167 [Alyxoria varia]|nr:MAG: hypothetical protein M1831_003167 [Alyxoria varia]